MLTFAQPLWIAAGCAAVILFWLLFHWVDTGKQQRLARFASTALFRELMPDISARRRTLKKTVLFIGIFCCFLTLARPQYGHRWIDVKHKGIDILFAVDTSQSMLAEDVLPNRLERSKLAIMDFVSQLEGDRIGLLPFAGTSYLVCPLTADYHAFEQSLMVMDTTIIPVGGTDIGDALRSAEKILNNEANHKILVLITDGEDLEGAAAEAAIKAKEQNLTVYTVGVGTTDGELIPDQKKGGFKKDPQGAYIKSRLDETSLSAIASSSGGMYVPLGNKGQGLETIYREKLALIPKTAFAEKRKKVPIERFQWPLAAAIFFLSLEYLLSTRKRSHQRAPFFFTRLLIAAVLPAVFLLPGAEASEPEEVYRTGNYIEAAEQYRLLLEKDPENPQLHYNSGTTSYQNNLYAEAAESFRKALVSNDVELQQKAYYNLGNTLFRKGEQEIQKSPKQTVELWKQALDAYNGALALNDKHEDARFNRDLVTERLKQLEEQQSRQQQNKDNSNQDENSEQDNDQKNEQTKNQQQDKKESDSDKEKPASQSENKDREEPEDSSPDDTEGKKEEDGEAQQTTPSPKEAEGTETDASMEPSGDSEKENAANELLQRQENEKDPETMTREEAENLLQVVEDEEGRLNLYTPIQEQQRTKNRSGKDW